MPIARDTRILLASSDAKTRLELARALVANYELVEASEGADVLVKLEACRPDIAVIDTDIGGLDGVEACRVIRQDSEFGTMPVFLLSRLDSRADFKRGYDAGATLYMVKPVDAARLLKNIGLTIQSEQITARTGRAEIAALRARGVPATLRGGQPVLLESIPVMAPEAPLASPSGGSWEANPSDRPGGQAGGGQGPGGSDAGLDRFLGRKGRAFLEAQSGGGSMEPFFARAGARPGAAPTTGFDFLDEPASERDKVKTGFDFLDELEPPARETASAPLVDAPAPKAPQAARPVPDLDFLDELDEPAPAPAFAGFDDLDVPETAGVVHARDSAPRAPTPPPYRPGRPAPPADFRAPSTERRSREGSKTPLGRPSRPGDPPREERRVWAERPATGSGDHPDLSFLDEPDAPRPVPARPAVDPLVGEREVDLSFLDVPDEVEPPAAPPTAPPTAPRAEVARPRPLTEGFGQPSAAEVLRASARAGRPRDRPISVADIMGLDRLGLEGAPPTKTPAPSLADVLGVSAEARSRAFESPAPEGRRTPMPTPFTPPPEPTRPPAPRPQPPGPLPAMPAHSVASVDLDDILGPMSKPAASAPPFAETPRPAPARSPTPFGAASLGFASPTSPDIPSSDTGLDELLSESGLRSPAPESSTAPPRPASREATIEASIEQPFAGIPVPSHSPSSWSEPEISSASMPEPLREPVSAPAPVATASPAAHPPPEPAPAPPAEPEPVATRPISKLPPPPTLGAVGPDGKKKSLNLRQLLGEPGKGGKPGLPPPPAPRTGGARPGAGAGGAGAAAGAAPQPARQGAMDSKILGMGAPGGDPSPDA